jgi:hypothetical protein
LEIDYNAGKKPRDKIDHHSVATALVVMEEPKDPGPHMRKPHHAIAIALSKMA